MIYNNIEFHNVAELEAIQNMPGLRLQRFPKAVRNELGHLDHERGRFYSEKSVGCEIRFTTTARFIRVSLSALEGDGKLFVFKGNFLHSIHELKSGIITTIHLEEPEKFAQITPEAINGFAFSSNVWRFLFGKDCCINFHNIDSFGHDINPPKENETPRIKWLAYGSSITFGGNTNLYSNAYVQQAARRLNIDVLNKGIAGSCFCDKSVVKYLSENTEWDFATLELGINMIGRFEPFEFEERARHLITTVVAKNPGKPVAVIGIYPNGALYSINKDNKSTRNNLAFNEISQRIVKELNNPNVSFIPGEDILTDYSGLSIDMVHPSDNGHIIMGENLSNKLKPIVDKLSK